MVVLSEAAPHDSSTVSSRELATITETVRLLGCRVYLIPADFAEVGGAENALAYVPEFEIPTTGIWVGYIPSVEHYSALYNAALAKGIFLVNTPAQHQLVTEFDHFYPLLKGNTPESIIVDSVADVQRVSERLGFPVFVKGLVKSKKESGWQACVAGNESELETIVVDLLNYPAYTRGQVVVRKLVPLRRLSSSYHQFPITREYRVFLYKQEVLGYGFYWDEQIESAHLGDQEAQAMLQLAKAASQQLQVPFLAIDVGQLETGEWIVIEVGDGQFSGLSGIPVLEIWGKLIQQIG